MTCKEQTVSRDKVNEQPTKMMLNLYNQDKLKIADQGAENLP